MPKYDLSADLDYYIKHQRALVQKYDGKYIIIAGQAVVGAYSTIDGAYQAAEKHGLQPGKYSIQLVGKGKENYTTVLSRVGFCA